MDVGLSESGLICLQELSREGFAELMLELIRTDGRLRSVIMDVACSCPNIVKEY